MCINKEKMIPLDMALDYPAGWGVWRILRDLIQNFYDSIGYEKFQEEFIYEYKLESDGTLTVTMKTFGHPFSYEWLVHFGGSTKTGKDGYIGCYGEGFKICALCSVKKGFYLVMESQNWRIIPDSYLMEVDGRSTEMLGYRLSERDDDGGTLLVLKGIPVRFLATVKDALLDFYYPENPLFGKKLGESDAYAVYERSDMPIPCRENGSELRGVLYYKYLARGRLPFDLVVIIKNLRYTETNGRDRRVLASHHVNELIYRAAEKMSVETSISVLEKLERHWRDEPVRGKHPDVDTWYYLICQLVRNASKSKEYCHEFSRKHPDYWYLDRKSADIIKNKRIQKAKEWYQKEHSMKMVVNPIFRLLGVPSLLEEYERVEEKCSYRQLDEKEDKMCSILESVLVVVMPGIRERIDTPEVLIANGSNINNPLLHSERAYGKNRNRYGKQKYLLGKIIMNESDFGREKFFETFLQYADICLHIYGADQSKHLNALLTLLAGNIAVESDLMRLAKEKWEVVHDTTESEKD